ncbi:glycosyltransferase family 1 protein [Backusella circina FSU 941]|nr:glycosyltransferase family 1 protein [Backusella circina FSU 941]
MHVVFVIYLLCFYTCLVTAVVQDLITDFRTSKNVIIGISIGGSSHAKWVLEIANILADRGHNVTFLTRDDQLSNARHYPNIRTHSFGDYVFPDPKRVSRAIQEMHYPKLNAYFKRNLNRVYPGELAYYQHHFFEHHEWRPDLFVCDAFNDACLDSALELRVPSVVTSTFVIRSNLPYINSIGMAPHYTSEKMTLRERMVTTYIEPLRFAYYLQPEFTRLDQLRERAGLGKRGWSPLRTWDTSLKLVNSFDGFKPAHVLDTMTHVVGPIMSSRRSNLTHTEMHFLESHKRVVYVAFGQHVMADRHDLEVLLGGLLSLLEDDLIDGVIWVRLEEQIRQVEKGEEEGRTNALSFKGVPFTSFREVLFRMQAIFATSWASQFAILQHPSTVLFVSHGGAESAHEALYNGKRMLIHPFYADQEMNGQALHVAGVALTHPRKTVTLVKVQQQMKHLLRDPEGVFGRNVSRMRTLTQINSNRKYHAADLLEEHMFASVQGVALHRIEASAHMSWWKARNIDLHITMLSAVLVTGYTLLHMKKRDMIVLQVLNSKILHIEPIYFNFDNIGDYKCFLRYYVQLSNLERS